MANKPVKFEELLKDAPKNWGRWGADDEIGALNFLTQEEVLRGAKAIRSGKVFMLGVPLARGPTAIRSTPRAPSPSARWRWTRAST
jgi:hypothetical protein